MRIWAFPSFYPHDAPGLKWTGIFAHRQYKGLADIGAEIKVIQPVIWHPVAPFYYIDKEWRIWAKFGYPAQRQYDGLTVYHPRVANMKPTRIFSKPYAEKYVDSIIDFFSKNNIKTDSAIDIFYAQWLPEAAVVIQAAHRMGLKCAILTVGDDVLSWPYKSEVHFDFIKKALLDADMRFAVAARLAMEARQIAGADLQFHVIRRGVNFDFFKPVSIEEKMLLRKKYGIPEDKTVILTIGAADVRKGWLDLFDALKEIKMKDNSFVLVGIQGGASKFNLNEQAKHRGLEAEFVNMVEVAPAEINMVHNIADIFCLPSHSEGIANSVVEAMSSGVAVIATDVGSHSELIKDGSSGILLPAQNPEILAAAILKLMNDETLRVQLGKNARDFIVNEWGSFADNGAKLYKLLASMLK